MDNNEYAHTFLIGFHLKYSVSNSLLFKQNEILNSYVDASKYRII